MNIQLSEEEKIRILNSEDLYGIMQRILLREQKIDQDREHFWVIGLGSSNQVLFIELISLGTVNKTIVEPMEVFSFALQKRAVNIMLVHNHPSGDLKPSASDKDVTNRLIQVGVIVNTQVIDHLIISHDKYVSFADMGLMTELRRSKKYQVPTTPLNDRIKKEADKILKKEIAKLTREKIAQVAEAKAKYTKATEIDFVKKCLKEGLPIKTIQKLTGLTQKEIKEFSNL